MHVWKERFDRLQADLSEVFGARLQSIVAYQTHLGVETGAPQGAADEHAHAMAIVESLSYTDLATCANKVAVWERAGIGVPLFMTREELAGSVDAFPLELAAIATHHVVVAGVDPFADLHVKAEDVRRACEAQAKSHLLHLREGFLEARGEPAAVARLVAASVPSFRTLLLNLARLDGVHAHNREALVHHSAARLGVPEALVERVLRIAVPQDLDRSDALTVYNAYLDASERLATFVDGWK